MFKWLSNKVYQASGAGFLLSTQGIWGRWMSQLFHTPTTSHRHMRDFEAVVALEGLNEEDLQIQSQRFRVHGVFYGFCCIAVLCYVGYSLWNQLWYSAFVSSLFSLYLGLLSARSYFWCFLIHQRTLGYSFFDWIRGKKETATVLVSLETSQPDEQERQL